MFWCSSHITLDRWQSKTLLLSTKVDQKSLETEFSIAICRPTGDKWQSKTLFLAIFDRCSSIVKGFFDCRLSSVHMYNHALSLILLNSDYVTTTLPIFYHVNLHHSSCKHVFSIRVENSVNPGQMASSEAS